MLLKEAQGMGKEPQANKPFTCWIVLKKHHFNAMITDGLGPHCARESAAMVLAYFWNIRLALAP